VLGLSSLSGAEPRTMYPAAHLMGAYRVAPLAVLSPGTGLLLGILTPYVPMYTQPHPHPVRTTGRQLAAR
jgi:hypothetical protein